MVIKLKVNGQMKLKAWEINYAWNYIHPHEHGRFG